MNKDSQNKKPEIHMSFAIDFSGARILLSAFSSQWIFCSQNSCESDLFWLTPSLTIPEVFGFYPVPCISFGSLFNQCLRQNLANMNFPAYSLATPSLVS